MNIRPLNKIVLFFPPYDSKEASPPLALIAIAAPLLKAGFQVRIIDGALEPDFLQRVMVEMDDALCLGISFCTGPMIKGAIAVSRAVKQKYPEKPVIFGGWHPSILARQTAEFDAVDVVVAKQGELTFLELVQRLAAREPWDDVRGIFYKKQGQVIANPERPYVRVADLASRVPAYALIDYDRYERRTGLRWLWYISSHGCPFRCGYCSNATVYGQHYDALPPDQVVAEITALVKQYRPQLLSLTDDIFLASRPRSLEIAEGFLHAGLKFQWHINDRVDSWEKLTPDQAALYRRAGMTRVHFGAESGSDRVLGSIQKKAVVGNLWEAIRRCQQAGIRTGINIIFALPAERETDFQQSLDLMLQVKKEYAATDIYTNIFTPYPGIPLWNQVVQAGFNPPENLEGWRNFNPRRSNVPWLQGAAFRRLQTIRKFFVLAHPATPALEIVHPTKPHGLVKVFRRLAQYRLARKWFAFPVDLLLFQKLHRLYRAFAEFKNRWFRGAEKGSDGAATTIRQVKN